MRMLTYGVGWAVACLLGWILAASLLFCWLSGVPIPSQEQPFAVLIYAPYIGRDLMETLWLVTAAALPTCAFLFIARVRLARIGGWRALKQSAGIDRIRRGASHNYGSADWMTEAELAALFPSEPDPELGGVVVGERDRVDLGPVAWVPFDPANRATWGNGGSAPLLIDHCQRGSTHSMVIGGGGTFKSTTLVTSLLTWRKGIFCLDPSEELADLVGAELESRDKRVVRLTIGGEGPNVLDYIDPESPIAETQLRSVVGRIVGPIDESNAKDSRFRKWGRTIILALAAHMMWDPEIPRELKTLRAVRAALDVGETRIRDILRGIAECSPSPMAQSLASSMHALVPDTFSGCYANATDDTEFLASAAYSSLVSGRAYPITDLIKGDLVVFVQVPQEALEHTPAVARVLTGCHLDAVFAARGQVNGRVFFPIDEAVLLGRDPALKIARDQGRKGRVSLQLFFQSEGQIEDVWGRAGMRAWFDGLSWRTYAGVQNLDTAREISGTLGTYGARAYSEGVNRGRAGRPFEIGSRSRGSNTNEHEINRELAKPHELLSEMRDDERITIVRNRKPLRHGAAIGFRRPEIAALLGSSRYQPSPRKAAEAARKSDPWSLLRPMRGVFARRDQPV